MYIYIYIITLYTHIIYIYAYIYIHIYIYTYMCVWHVLFLIIYFYACAKPKGHVSFANGKGQESQSKRLSQGRMQIWVADGPTLRQRQSETPGHIKAVHCRPTVDSLTLMAKVTMNWGTFEIWKPQRTNQEDYNDYNDPIISCSDQNARQLYSFEFLHRPIELLDLFLFLFKGLLLLLPLSFCCAQGVFTGGLSQDTDC